MDAVQSDTFTIMDLQPTVGGDRLAKSGRNPRLGRTRRLEESLPRALDLKSAESSNMEELYLKLNTNTRSMQFSKVIHSGRPALWWKVGNASKTTELRVAFLCSRFVLSKRLLLSS